MLRLLAIRNLAIIDALEIEFGPGLNVLTGETGAGKSIIIGALELVLGARGSTDWIRSGASRASADAVFDVAGAEAFLDYLNSAGCDPADGDLVLSRELQDTGRSLARVNGRPATLAQLREFGEWLVDLHGQHEHQSLLTVSRHCDVLDDWGGPEVASAIALVGDLWMRLRDLRQEAARLETDARERLRLMDLYRYQVNEIGAASLEPGEEERLVDEARRLRNVERLSEAVTASLDLLHNHEGSVVEQLAAAAERIGSAAAVDSSLSEVAEAVHALRYEVEEAAWTLSRYLDTLEADPRRLEQVEDRLSRIADLKRKYGSTIEAILEYGKQAAKELERLEHAEELADSLSDELASAEAEFEATCRKLTELRKRTARKFEESVNRELADVALNNSRFSVAIAAREPGPKGADSVEFLFAANAGEPLRPLARIASGGEISRVMLAIKSAAASQSPLPTMVFDEIDAGIGGRTADAIAQKMRNLSRNAQVICITHLAPIAAAADVHYAIEKEEREGRTVVRVRRLDDDERVEELSRMLAGTAITDAVRDHVRALFRRAAA